jgi:hypothetical protein
MAFFSQIGPRPAARRPVECQLLAPPRASQAAPRLVLWPPVGCRTLSRLLGASGDFAMSAPPAEASGGAALSGVAASLGGDISAGVACLGLGGGVSHPDWAVRGGTSPVGSSPLAGADPLKPHSVLGGTSAVDGASSAVTSDSSTGRLGAARRYRSLRIRLRTLTRSL